MLHNMKNVLMKDIAAKANVSVATVSYILNNTPNQSISAETRQNVLKIAKELCYVPNLNARSLASKKSGLIGVLNVKGNINKPWKDFQYFKFVNQVEELLKASGYDILISSVDNSNPELDIILQRELDGVFLLDVKENIFYNISHHFSTPIILIDSYLEDDFFTKIVPDYEAAIAKAKNFHNNEQSFLIMDKANNQGVLNKIITASGLDEQHILLVENEDEIHNFLNRYQYEKGIVINEYLAMLSAKYTSLSNLAVICTCDCPEILPDKTIKVTFKKNKSDIAANLITSYIKKDFPISSNKYSVIQII